MKNLVLFFLANLILSSSYAEVLSTCMADRPIMNGNFHYNQVILNWFKRDWIKNHQSPVLDAYLLESTKTKPNSSAFRGEFGTPMPNYVERSCYFSIRSAKNKHVLVSCYNEYDGPLDQLTTLVQIPWDLAFAPEKNLSKPFKIFYFDSNQFRVNRNKSGPDNFSISRSAKPRSFTCVTKIKK